MNENTDEVCCDGITAGFGAGGTDRNRGFDIL